MPSMLPTAPIVADFASLLERAGFVILLGGSFASSAWGQPRATNDADFSIWLEESRVPELLALLTDPYYVSEDDVRSALSDKADFAMFQVLNMDEAFKFDLFIADRTPMDAEAQARAVRVSLGAGEPVLTACAEHIFVLKLRWYDAGRRASERQWRDLVEIALARKTLDRPLVARWSAEFGLTDLAAEILAEADAREAE